MRSDVGKTVPRRILDVKLKVPQRREKEACGGVLIKGENTPVILLSRSVILLAIPAKVATILLEKHL